MRRLLPPKGSSLWMGMAALAGAQEFSPNQPSRCSCRRRLAIESKGDFQKFRDRKISSGMWTVTLRDCEAAPLADSAEINVARGLARRSALDPLAYSLWRESERISS